MSSKNNGTKTAPGKAITAPQDFPVTWENPEDGRLHWTYDGYHYPEPVAPLEYELTAAIYEEGINRAIVELNIPFRVKSARINTYFYRAAFPVGAPPDGVARLMNQARRFVPGVVGAIKPPAMLGTVPLMPPPVDEPLLRGLMKTSGETPVPSNGAGPDVVRGHAGSPGTVRGPAKIVRTLAEAGYERQASGL